VSNEPAPRDTVRLPQVASADEAVRALGPHPHQDDTALTVLDVDAIAGSHAIRGLVLDDGTRPGHREVRMRRRISLCRCRSAQKPRAGRNGYRIRSEAD
jgi:hypothetical protein